MNRHQRRRAAALARGHTGYLHRLLAAVHAGALPRTGMVHGAIEHDPDCGIYRGLGCTCVPDISISAPDGVVVVDEHGQGRKVARS